MLRKIRIVVAALFFALVTLLFLDFTGALHTWFGWMAKVQLLPAVLALNVGVIVFLVVLTLLFGRVYCSVICPMGVFQDIVSWLNGRRKGKKNRFGYKNKLLYTAYYFVFMNFNVFRGMSYLRTHGKSGAWEKAKRS